MSKIVSRPAPKPRLSPKLRAAIHLRVTKGLSITAACREAGLSESGFTKAMRRPAVQDHMREVQAAYVASVDQLRAQARVRAIEVARDLLENAKSESIRADMAKFLASDTKAAGPSVQVNVATAPGYAFARPGQRVVDVIDDTSEA